MLREPWHHVAVVHSPAVDAGEVLTDVPAGQRRGGAEAIVALGEVIDMVHAEKERVLRLPARPQGRNLNNRVAHQPTLPFSHGVGEYSPAGNGPVSGTLVQRPRRW